MATSEREPPSPGMGRILEQIPLEIPLEAPPYEAIPIEPVPEEFPPYEEFPLPVPLPAPPYERMPEVLPPPTVSPPFDLCGGIFGQLCREDGLFKALMEKAALEYLHELSRFYVGVRKSNSLETVMQNLYAVKQVEPAPALQIIESVNRKLLEMNIHSRYQRSALIAACRTLEALLERPANLPFASADEIQTFLCQDKRTLRIVLMTFYAKYLCQIIYYHYLQAAPYYVGPQKGYALSERRRQVPEGSDRMNGTCDPMCKRQAKKVADILDQTCQEQEKCGLEELGDLRPEIIKALVLRAERRLQEALTA